MSQSATNIAPLERGPAPWPVKSKALSQPSAGEGQWRLRSSRSAVFLPMFEHSSVVVDDTLPGRLWKSPWRREGRNLLQGARKPRSPFESSLPEGQTPRDEYRRPPFWGQKQHVFPRCYIELFVSRARRRLKCRRCVPGPPSPAGEGPDSGRKALTKRLLPFDFQNRCAFFLLPHFLYSFFSFTYLNSRPLSLPNKTRADFF